MSRPALPAWVRPTLIPFTIWACTHPAWSQYRIGTGSTVPATAPATAARGPLPAIDEATAILNITSTFAGPAVGFAGVEPPEHKAFRAVLASPDAAERFERLTSTAKPAGQLYGLQGLRVIDKARYARVVRAFEGSEMSVGTMSGCFMTRDTVGSVIAAWKVADSKPATSQPRSGGDASRR